MSRPPRHEESSDAPARSDIVAIIAAIIVFVAALIVIISAVDPVGAGISASTDNRQSLMEAAAIDLEVDNARGLLFDVDGLYPGVELTHCVPITYRGSLDAVDVRLTADNRADSAGLARYVSTEISIGTGTDPDCEDHVLSARLYSGTLEQLWAGHPDFSRGLSLGEDVASVFETTLRVTATVLDTNAAQGLTSDFQVRIEARP